MIYMLWNEIKEERCRKKKDLYVQTFLKKFTCKHLVGLAICLKYVKPSAVSERCSIDQKRQRRRST